MGPLLTTDTQEILRDAAARGISSVDCSFDLQRSITRAELSPEHWIWQGHSYPFPANFKERTIYHWYEGGFQPVARYANSLIKLVPTQWGPPTFEIDGIKMLPTSRLSPYVDAQRKVDLIRPHGKSILDTCGGLGYFASWCRRRGAAQVLSYEKNPDVIWLRDLNPWSPAEEDGLRLINADIAVGITRLPDEHFAAVLHDPPRFGIAGELYSQDFYNQLSRVLRRRGSLFHYTGTPNRLTTGRDVPNEVSRRLRQVGFDCQITGDGVLAFKVS